MDTYNLVLTIITVLLLASCHGFLNIEELTDVKYGLDILSKPLNALELNPADGLRLASKHGQDYYCTMPVPLGKDSEGAEDRIPKSTPISSLLEPMRKESCLKSVKGWWTYEFCYGKHIKQYHSEGDLLKGEITYLGYYESDFDWSRQALDESTHLKRHKLNRYHSQTYVNGTACDVINHKRDTEIRYLCDDSSSETYIERVDEPSTCSYVITVHTPYICSHPHTRPVKSPKPLDIVCQPILKPHDYEAYQKKKIEELQKRKEKLEKYVKAAQIMYNKATGHFQPAAEDRQKILYQEEKLRLEERMEESEEEDTAADGADAVPAEEKFFNDFFKLLDLLVPRKKLTKSEEERQNSPFKGTPTDGVSNPAVQMIERFIVRERLQSMDAIRQRLLVRNVDDLMKINANLPTADLARLLQKYISNFVEIVEEIQERDKQMDEVQDKLGESFTNELMDTFQHMLPKDGDPTSDSDVDDDKDATEKKGPLSVKLKVTKLKDMSEMANLKAEDLSSDKIEDPVELDPTWKKLEEDIGKGLEEAGYGDQTGGSNHIEIRVVTNHENIGDSMYLDEEEGQRFRSMLLELVAGGAARRNEVKKQKVLYDNYNVVWKEGVAESFSKYEEEPDDAEAEIKSPKL